MILAGYGIAGEQVAEALRRVGRQYVVVDMNAETVRRLSGEGEPAFYGDVTSPAVLESLGIGHAAELVVAVNDPGATERAIRSARGLSPRLRIVARTQYAIDGPGLRDAGADEVITAETEAASRLVEIIVPPEPASPDA